MMPTDPGAQSPTRTMQLPLDRPADEPVGKRRRWLRWAVPLLAFLVGAGVGGVGGQTDVAAAPQYLALQDELEVARAEAGELGDEVVAAEEEARQAATAAQVQVEQQTAAISQRATALDQRETELAARESALRAAEQTATSSSSSSSGSSSSGSVSSGSVSSGAGSAAVVEPEPQVASSASYANCSEARAAGAAPVRAGDPGYSRRLDRDGDGVGCE